MWKKLQRCGEEFCLETSMHGFSHVAAPGRHWIERFIWVGVICVAIWGMTEITLGQLQRYNENPTVVTLEKDFRTWSFSLPAITACDENRVDPTKLAKAVKSRWNVSPEDERYQYYSRFVRTVANSDLYHLDGYEEFADDATLDVDLKQLVVDVARDPHVKISSSLTMNAKWTPVMTEAGVCHVTNSLATADVAIVDANSNDSKLLPFTCEYSSMSCYVLFEAFLNVDYYIHSPYDVVDLTTPPSRTYVTLNRFTELSVQETKAGEGVRELQPRRRRCLYTDEPVDSSRQVYSTNTCRQACRRRLAVDLCGCTPFYYFYDGSPCTPAGMACLARHAALLSNSGGVKCVCAQHCLDAVYREISTEDQIWGKGIFQNKGSVRFTVQAPRARYTREIVFHFQDLVVSFGGAAGLFLGASFLSFVELGYLVLLRCLRLLDRREPAAVFERPIPFEKRRIQEITWILKDNETRF